MLGVSKQLDRPKSSRLFLVTKILSGKTEIARPEDVRERSMERFVLFERYERGSRDTTDQEIFLKKELLRIDKMEELMAKERRHILRTMKERTLLEKVLGRITKKPANQNLRNIETHLEQLHEERSIVRFEFAKLHL